MRMAMEQTTSSPQQRGYGPSAEPLRQINNKKPFKHYQRGQRHGIRDGQPTGLTETFLKMTANTISLEETSVASLKLLGVTLHKQEENIGNHM